MSLRVFAGFVTLVVVGGVFAFGLSKQGEVSRIDASHVAVPPAGFQTYPAAPIASSSVHGAAFSLASLRGRFVFINFWAPNCAPCVREAPQLRAFADGLGGRATMMGVAIDTSGVDARNFALSHGWNYPILTKRCCDLIDSYGVVGLPTTIVVDRQGIVVDRLVGPQTTARLRAELRALNA
jgi:cytochrome c biogenesis protein CcmG, thiol:disulfide interchange protein DsbE